MGVGSSNQLSTAPIHNLTYLVNFIVGITIAVDNSQPALPYGF